METKKNFFCDQFRFLSGWYSSLRYNRDTWVGWLGMPKTWTWYLKCCNYLKNIKPWQPTNPHNKETNNNNNKACEYQKLLLFLAKKYFVELKLKDKAMVGWLTVFGFLRNVGGIDKELRLKPRANECGVVEGWWVGCKKKKYQKTYIGGCSVGSSNFGWLNVPGGANKSDMHVFLKTQTFLLANENMGEGVFNFIFELNLCKMSKSIQVLSHLMDVIDHSVFFCFCFAVFKFTQ